MRSRSEQAGLRQISQLVNEVFMLVSTQPDLGFSGVRAQCSLLARIEDEIVTFLSSFAALTAGSS